MSLITMSYLLFLQEEILLSLKLLNRSVWMGQINMKRVEPLSNITVTKHISIVIQAFFFLFLFGTWFVLFCLAKIKYSTDGTYQGCLTRLSYYLLHNGKLLCI